MLGALVLRRGAPEHLVNRVRIIVLGLFCRRGRRIAGRVLRRISFSFSVVGLGASAVAEVTLARAGVMLERPWPIADEDRCLRMLGD